MKIISFSKIFYKTHLSGAVELQFLLKVPLITSEPASCRYGITG